MEGEWSCKRHPGEQVGFICTGNAWHFEPLCNACLPDHTQSHPKNIKVHLQHLRDILPKARDLKLNLSAAFQQRYDQAAQLALIKDQDFAYVNSINQRREALLKEVHAFFDDLIAQIKKKRAEEEHLQHQNLIKISEQMKEKIAFFKKEDYSDISSFCNEIKKYYFKENMETYVEEVDEVLKEYQEKTIAYDPLVWAKDISLKLKKLLSESYRADDPATQNKEKPDPKKETKRKEPGRRRCPNCKEEMEYLTEWKKHLVCRSCGAKERNYGKKI